MAAASVRQGVTTGQTERWKRKCCIGKRPCVYVEEIIGQEDFLIINLLWKTKAVRRHRFRTKAQAGVHYELQKPVVIFSSL